MIQPLEPRRLFAASAKLDDGTLFVRGSDLRDVIEFQAEPGAVVVSIGGNTKTFDAALIRSIRIDAGAGSDRIVLGKKIRIDATIFGGYGNDTISGGAGDDTIFGGQGNDDLAGQDGNDYLDGQRGDDSLRDYAGRNTFHGGAGRDVGLVDPALLGSGIESRRMVVDRGESISPYDIYDVPERFNGAGTYLTWEKGRLILEYFGGTGSGSNRVKFSKLRVRDDGRYEVEVKITTPPTGYGSTADMKYFTHRWDVTETTTMGLVFMNKTVHPGSDDGSIATQVTRQSSVLLVANAPSE